LIISILLYFSVFVKTIFAGIGFFSVLATRFFIFFAAILSFWWQSGSECVILMDLGSRENRPLEEHHAE